MDPEPSEVVVPVRPKTTHVRIGRQRPTEDETANGDDANRRSEPAPRPKTSQVRMSRDENYKIKISVTTVTAYGQCDQSIKSIKVAQKWFHLKI